MIKEIQVDSKKGLLHNIPQELIINSNYISFKNNNQFATLKNEEIIEYRYGIQWIRGIEFTIGREYQIFIKSRDNKIIKIRFRSLYRNKIEEIHENYSNVLNALWSFYFRDITENLIEKFNNNEPFIIGQVNFSKQGLTIKTSELFKSKKVEIEWQKVRTKNYQTYFTIYSSEKPEEFNRGYSYMDDWNTAVLYSVVRTILMEKQIETYD